MLQRLNAILDEEEPQCGNGVWSRQQLLEQNDRFVAAMERAFAAGLESPEAARARNPARWGLCSSRCGVRSEMQISICRLRKF